MQSSKRWRQAVAFVVAAAIGVGFGVSLVRILRPTPQGRARSTGAATPSAPAPRGLSDRFAVLKSSARPLPRGLVAPHLITTFGLLTRAARKLPTDVGLVVWLVPGASGMCVVGEVDSDARGAGLRCGTTQQIERTGLWASTSDGHELLYGILPDGFSSVDAIGLTRTVVGVQAVENNLVVFAGSKMALVHHVVINGRQRTARVAVAPPGPGVSNPELQAFGIAPRASKRR